MTDAALPHLGKLRSFLFYSSEKHMGTRYRFDRRPMCFSMLESRR